MIAMLSNTINLQENVSLAAFTTFDVGGPARYFAQVSSELDAVSALAFARERSLDHVVLGGGSNVLISDEGFPGLAILNRIKGVTIEEAGSSVLVTVGGGEDWQDFTDLCVAKDWQGVECLAGIPGTVGASPIQNIGAYGQEVSQVISRVHCLETATGKAISFDNEECAFRYRESIFSTREAGKYLVLAVTFKLIRSGAPAIKYRELAERLSGVPSPALTEVRDAVIAIRAGKGVLVRDGYESFKSAGSFFKNPIISQAQFNQIKSIVAENVESTSWFWPLPNGDVKISAAYLIQCSGFDKGYCQGKVGISPYHTLILINSGGASARELVDFAAEVQQRILDSFGILLKPEARLVGFATSSCSALP